MRNIFCLMSVLFLSWNIAYGQKIVEYKGDTVVLMTRENVQTMNSIIVEREYLIEEVSVLTELCNIKDSVIFDQDEVIRVGQKIIVEQKEKYDLEIQRQVTDLRLSKKKAVKTWASITAAIGLILGFLLGNC